MKSKEYSKVLSDLLLSYSVADHNLYLCLGREEYDKLEWEDGLLIALSDAIKDIAERTKAIKNQ